jgi:hypothetical protein
MSVGDHEMRHDLLVYHSDDVFATYVGLFVEEGLEAGQPVVVVTDPVRRAVLMDTLSAADAAGVTFMDRDRIYTRPEAALARYDTEVRVPLRKGARAVRVYGELPVWKEPGQWESWLRYEAVVDRAFAEQPVWITCGYDARVVPYDVVENAWRTHREVHSHGWQENPHYEPPADVLRSLATPRVELPGLHSLPLAEDERAFRRLLTRELAADGMDADKAADLLEAAAAVLANAETHGRGLRGLRAGRVGERFVCEIADGGPGLDDPLAGYVPPRRRRDPTGLWNARQLTKQLDLLSSDSGLTVRLWV